MPPKQASAATRGRPRGSKNKPRAAEAEPESSDPFASSPPPAAAGREEDAMEAEEDGAPQRQQRQQQQPEKTIPRELLTRVLHEFFGKEATRISRDANAAVGKYVDVFVREAIARAAVERKGAFLEVEDLEKIAPQLLLDL